MVEEIQDSSHKLDKSLYQRGSSVPRILKNNNPQSSVMNINISNAKKVSIRSSRDLFNSKNF